ncbi:MAG: NADH-quinone oxidoreductase subunit NuoB [Coriobacteriales bacterium]|jgi:ech hydrogenase subunit C|nr:NADH-quinone oxidoreductase subunit NuoB [Coriobacteriales bacterium]
MSSTIKSPWLIHYDASSCNGCDIEVLACLTPMYDVERFGIINTGNPKHADVFLVTGSVNERNITVVQQIYEQMLEPKVVIACGICACTGGIFKECYNTLGGVDVAIPVDVYAPGCAIRPEAIIDAVVLGLGILEEKRVALAAGTLPTPELPVCVSAADKLVDGQTVRAEALESAGGSADSADSAGAEGSRGVGGAAGSVGAEGVGGSGSSGGESGNA